MCSLVVTHRLGPIACYKQLVKNSSHIRWTTISPLEMAHSLLLTIIRPIIDPCRSCTTTEKYATRFWNTTTTTWYSTLPTIPDLSIHQAEMPPWHNWIQTSSSFIELHLWSPSFTTPFWSSTLRIRSPHRGITITNTCQVIERAQNQPVQMIVQTNTTHKRSFSRVRRNHLQWLSQTPREDDLQCRLLPCEESHSRTQSTPPSSSVF